MSEADTSSCIIDIPKPRVFVNKTWNSVKAHNVKWTFERNLKKRSIKVSDELCDKCILPGNKPLATTTLQRDDLLLSCRQYLRKQQTERHKKRLAIGIYDKHKINTGDVKKRTHVDDPPDDVTAIIDMDKDFFNCVNGRPLVHQGPLYKSLNDVLFNRLRITQEIGFRHDCALNIDINYRQEQEKYHKTLKRCINEAKVFDKFISDDYLKSMAILKKWEMLKVSVNIKNMELQTLATRMFTIQSRLICLDYKNSVQQKYGRFLFYISPMVWRAQNREFATSMEIESKGFDYGKLNDEDPFGVVLEKMKSMFVGNVVPPVMYFNQPNELKGFFETVEKQLQNHLIYVTKYALQARNLKKLAKSFRTYTAFESASLVNTIEDIESKIKFYEQRNSQLKARFFEVIFGLFYKSVGTADVLKFFLHLSFCFEKVYDEAPTNMDIMAIAKNIELMWMRYMKRLDTIESHDVGKAIDLYINAEKQKNKMAKNAAKELRLFDRLKVRLRRAFTIPNDNVPLKAKVIQNFPTKKNRKQNTKEKNKRNPLTDAEKDYLVLFTKWTEKDNPDDFLHVFDDNAFEGSEDKFSN